MIGQTLSALKGLWAKRADKRLIYSTTPVSLQRKQVREMILTQRAHVGVWLLEAVLTHVSGKGRLVGKLRPTV